MYGRKRTYIIQKYLEKPLLYKSRKFDIRVYAMTTTSNGNLQGYFYTEGYLRTSCKEYNIKNANNRMIHLTNDAVQKKSEDYGKYENGNKVSNSHWLTPFRYRTLTSRSTWIAPTSRWTSLRWFCQKSRGSCRTQSEPSTASSTRAAGSALSKSSAMISCLMRT